MTRGRVSSSQNSIEFSALETGPKTASQLEEPTCEMTPALCSKVGDTVILIVAL